MVRAETGWRLVTRCATSRASTASVRARRWHARLISLSLVLHSHHRSERGGPADARQAARLHHVGLHHRPGEPPRAISLPCSRADFSLCLRLVRARAQTKVLGPTTLDLATLGGDAVNFFEKMVAPYFNLNFCIVDANCNSNQVRFVMFSTASPHLHFACARAWPDVLAQHGDLVVRQRVRQRVHLRLWHRLLPE